MTYERDWKKIDDLIISGYEGTEIASHFNVHPETLYRWVEEEKNMGFAEYHRRKSAKGEGLIKAHQFAKALGLTDKGDTQLLLWLGKTRCKQKEYTEPLPSNDQNLDQFYNNLPSLHDYSILLEKFKKVEEKLNEFERQADTKHSGSQEKVQHLGGSSSEWEDLLKYPEVH